MTIEAKIVADSISTHGIRLVTMELTYPRFIHSEFMTHRMFSRNASSSRAIPVEKMLEQVKNSPAMPIHWGKNQPGMQAKEEVETSTIIKGKELWWEASISAKNTAEKLNSEGIHKQVTNRLLEPFQYIKVIVTATEWDNFFNLRLHPDAQPEMRVLAEHMQAAMNGSTPTELEHGEWHLPYVVTEDCVKTTTDNFVKLSVARCARVSYLNHDSSSPDVEKDIALADRLLKDGHMSPFEHQATPMDFKYVQQWYDLKGVTHQDIHGEHWSSNFRGWRQYRQMITRGIEND